MSAKIILDLCAGTGAWSQPYQDANYDVRLITLPEFDVRTFHPPPEHVHGILAAPPCTMFSIARTRAKIPRNLVEGMQTIRACLSIIWTCQQRGDPLAFWCLENPRGLLRRFLGKPALTFQPCEFGDPSGKNTDLWGIFTVPRKLAAPVVFPRGHHGASAWHDNPGKGNRAVMRAMTPPHFAHAFFKANP